MIPFPIETAPKHELDHEPVPVLLYCPDEGGWHTGVWFEASWRLHADIERELNPTHWLPAPGEDEAHKALEALARTKRRR